MKPKLVLTGMVYETGYPNPRFYVPSPNIADDRYFLILDGRAYEYRVQYQTEPKAQ